MQNLITLLVLGAAAVQTSSLGLRTTRSDPVLVRAVLDGDTIDVSTVGRVRLLGVDAPEIGRQYDTPAPFAREARERLASLVLKHWVRLEWDGPTRDVYNRHLAYVVCEDGLFVNAALVREGLARVTARLPLARLDELNRAEREAQAFRRGMWGAAPSVPQPSYTPPSTGTPLPSSPTTKKPRTTRSKPKTAP
jgi:endonuclease YncB( thermonuclease family)